MMASLCELPAFKEPLGDGDGTELELLIANNGFRTELLIADCGGRDPEIVCNCCMIYCSGCDQDCNKNTAIPNMDPTWEAS
jgi:hypothetical protein